MRFPKKVPSKTSLKSHFQRVDARKSAQVAQTVTSRKGTNWGSGIVSTDHIYGSYLRIVDERVHPGVARRFLHVFQLSFLLVELLLHLRQPL